MDGFEILFRLRFHKNQEIVLFDPRWSKIDQNSFSRPNGRIKSFWWVKLRFRVKIGAIFGEKWSEF